MKWRVGVASALAGVVGLSGLALVAGTPEVAAANDASVAPAAEVIGEHTVVDVASKGRRTNMQTKKKGKQTFTAPKTVQRAQRFTLTGSVPWTKKVRGKRKVVLQVKAGGKWGRVASKKVGSKKRVTFIAKRNKAGTVAYRLVAPKVKKKRKVVAKKYTSPSLKVMVIVKPKTPTTPVPMPTAEPAPTPPAPTPPAPTPPAPTVTPVPRPTVPPVPTSTATPTPTRTATPTPTPSPSLFPMPLAPRPYDEHDHASDPWNPFSPNPTGRASDWTSIASGVQTRWDSCAVITWDYDPTGSYTGSLGDMKKSFDRVSKVSGLRFRYIGVNPTDAVMESEAEIKVQWRDLPEGNLGVARTSYYVRPTGYEIFQSTIDLTLNYAFAPGLDAIGDPYPYPAGVVMQHELMHAVGLGHAEEPTQIMHPYITPTGYRMGAGDLAGMRAVGSDQGCL